MSTVTTTTATPVIVIGKTATIGSQITRQLLPEYTTIHFLSNASHAKSNISKILAGTATKADLSDDTVGSLDLSARPEAVLVGGAFSEEVVEEIRKVINEGDSKGVPWLVRGPNGVERMGPLGPEYVNNAVKSIKETLAKMREGGQMGKDGLYYW